jgi:anti-sigma-K factor RskA
MADEERKLDAAERALGTEPSRAEPKGGERAEDRDEREAWEMRLAPLLDPIPPIAPPDGLFDRILERIDADQRVIDLATVRWRASRWKAAAIAAGVAAAALAAIAVLPIFLPPSSERYVAIVTSDSDGTAGLVVQFDTGTGVATVIPVGIPVPAGRSLEMWYLPVGADRPRSLGLLPATPEELPQLEAGPGDLFAVSIEPEGGSPTGQPTQPIYHGRIARVK